MNSVNTFSVGSKEYALYRPKYPDEIFEYLSSLCINHNRALDCAAGTGQAAIGLAKFFQKVNAIDISQEQLNNANREPNIEYSLSKAEHTCFPNLSFDLIVVAQALHWFNYNTFWGEVDRILQPGGVFAAWGYDWFSIDDKTDKIIEELILNPIAPYWSKKNEILWSGYKKCGMPFDKINSPQFRIEKEIYPIELINYIKTWSAYKKYVALKNNEYTIKKTLDKLNESWHTTPKNMTMNLHVLIGKKKC